jgi:hypothetical protein
VLGALGDVLEVVVGELGEAVGPDGGDLEHAPRRGECSRSHDGRAIMNKIEVCANVVWCENTASKEKVNDESELRVPCRQRSTKNSAYSR